MGHMCLSALSQISKLGFALLVKRDCALKTYTFAPCDKTTILRQSFVFGYNLFSFYGNYRYQVIVRKPGYHYLTSVYKEVHSYDI